MGLLDPPVDNRFALPPGGEEDAAALRRWADRIPGIGKWFFVSDFGYQNTFADFDTTRRLRIRREFADIVRLDGIIKTTGNVGYNTLVVTLPPQFRPARPVQMPSCLMATSAGVSYVNANLEIATGGAITLTEWDSNATSPITVGYFRVAGTYPLSADK